MLFRSPNSQLVTEKVTNWTLNDLLVRINLPVGINYGATPQKIMTLLEYVAAKHPRVLADPPPRGLFVGFGDSSLNFELQVWTDSFDNRHRVKSDLASAVYDEVLAGGMTFPFPQREIRILKDAEAGDVKATGLKEEMIAT